MTSALRPQTFATPKRHHKAKPFFDHVLSFTLADGRIWVRNYQASSFTVSTNRHFTVFICYVVLS